jgi:methyl-accepting chemotaxis protein
MPEAEIRAVTWSVGIRLAIGSLLSMLLAVGATLWLLRRKLRPLSDLVHQAEALGAGDLNVRLKVASEISSFCMMSSRDIALRPLSRVLYW